MNFGKKMDVTSNNMIQPYSCSGCVGTCKGSCVGSCKGSCSGSCKGSCMGSSKKR